ATGALLALAPILHQIRNVDAADSGGEIPRGARTVGGRERGAGDGKSAAIGGSKNAAVAAVIGRADAAVAVLSAAAIYVDVAELDGMKYAGRAGRQRIIDGIRIALGAAGRLVHQRLNAGHDR